ncbi:integrase catalytic domain-containing protein [Trichonephila clavipes]|uniref:Integrase catalytic domain-containing protein n=1 Tax=Trichonephila clavipes TaxID=2585209 RepID=A0A8X6SBS3_TRICX|nr:integrase catalytic domain-containing protein [Trichonephila clavipes]
MTPLSGESSTQILNLIDSTKEFVRMLESLEYQVDPTSDTLLMHMILFKLDPNSRTWFERTFSTDVIPKLDELLQFLATHARSITSSTTKRNVQRKVTLVASKAQSQCPSCNGDHTLSICDTFSKLSVQGRSDFVKKNNVCFNCLTQFHSVKTCKSKFRCKRCEKPHHSLLHIENVSANGRQGAVNVLNSRELSSNAPVFSPVPISGFSEPSENSRVLDVTSCISDVNSDVQILLCTALIQVIDIWGNYQTCRCLLDSGSQALLITNECIERLGLRKEKANVRISCLGASDTRLNGLAEIQFTSQFSSQNSFHASVYVINKILGMIPHHDLDSSMRELFGDISLADPAFYKSGPIDVLLGVDLTLPLLKGQTLSLDKDKPFAIRSELGWIIGGKANSSGQNSFHVNHIQLVSDHLINKFWELDSVPRAKPLTSLEEACEDHFVKTHSRDENGRYTVRLSFHTSPTRLGNSKQNAICRLISVECHLISNPDKYKLYRNFMKEYLDIKHMCVCVEPVPESEINNIKSLYLPHHGVVRDISFTTKLRVVFDAFSKTSSGLSLNDLLMVGPRVQPELFPILIQFRIFSVAICVDVEKMFRQIKVHEEDVDWQRILWRDSPTKPIREYRLTTVTYGTSSAPFLSTRTLRQLAIDEQENYPAASRVTLSHFYVDDLLSGSATKKGAIQLVSDLQEMMKRGGFSLRKWVSNDPDVLATIPEELKAVDSKHTIKDDPPVKILGIAWLPDVDKFTFTITVNETDVWTKRKSDSKITLAWLKSDPRRWQPFVANRVAQIQELTPNVHWNFVSGLENPADCGTRGIPPSKLERCNLWFNGPDWLKSSTFPIGEFEDNPQLQEHMSVEAKRTSKLIMLNVVDATFKAEFFQKFSSWNKLKRVVAYCLRFVKNCSLSACKRRKSFLTTAELSEAEKGIVKFIQRDHFSWEVSYLSADSQKHPILLPKTDHVVNLIISDYHLKLLHAGPQLLQAALREKFWILSARDSVRRVVRRCISCFRNRPKFAEQIMGDLPESRVCPSSVFQRTEVVSDLTSKAFIACLKRFVARRGKPSEIFCDQGTNFYGASRDLRKEFRQLMKEDAVHQFLVTDNITFHFNPPSAPHFGGIWEATVKSFKFYLNRVVGVTSLTFEELSTLSNQIETCLNSRPLGVLSSSPDDPCVLTPGHFLIGKALTAIPQPTVPDDLRHCDRWRLLIRMTQHFWNRWSSEYLTLLQSRSKWRIVQKNLDIGDLVLIKHDNSPPLQWKLGKVTETFPGKNSKVRVVEETWHPLSKLLYLRI